MEDIPDLEPRSRRGKWVVLALALLPLGYSAWDLSQSLRHAGLYQRDWSGAVVSARPTLKNVVSFFDSDRRRDRAWSGSGWRDGINRGLYAATLTTDEGRTLVVGLSYRDYSRTLIPGYLVSRNGQVSVFTNRDDAVAHHALDADARSAEAEPSSEP